MAETLHIGALQGGGINLGYRCPSRCQHCLYGCGGHRRDGEPVDHAALCHLLDLLAERAPHARYHIGGGEPFLDVSRLRKTIAGLDARGLALEYVETNAYWVKSARAAEQILEDLAVAGLRALLVSLSPFHAEFVPPDRAGRLASVANRCLPGGAIIWLPEMVPYVSETPVGACLDLDGLLAMRGDAYAQMMSMQYGLISGGRAGRFLHAHGQRVPWREAARQARCRERLGNTSHFHVDFDGNYIPGLCGGIVLPIASVPGSIDLEPYPVLGALLRGGPAALVELAREHGFTPHETYSGACDLCTHARLYLFPHGFDELGPAGFYDPRSVPGHV